MKSLTLTVAFAGTTLVVTGLGLVMLQRTTVAQAPAPAAAPRPTAQTYARHSEVGGRLASTEQQYSTIDGRRLKGYVEELAAMSRRYRDSGHQFWGRIIGSTADAENAQWMMDKFKQNGLSDIHMQPFDLPPQWMAQSWSVNATGKGQTIKVETAQPTYLAVGTPPAGLNLEAVYVAQGSEADIALSKGVRGKAAIFYSTDVTSRHIGIGDNAIKRLEEHGAAAIFIGMNIQGNMRTQFYPVGSKVPTFSLGQGDTLALRDLIAANGSEPTRMKVQLTVQEVPNLKSGTVWGTLPGTTDEEIIVVAHRDGWFEGANDNAAGVATMIGLVEYFSKIPQAQRRRTIRFLGTTGHHNNGAQSGMWLLQHPETFAKAALLVNCEHTGAVETGHATTRASNAPGVSTWFAGSPKLADIVIKAMDAFEVATYPQSGNSAGGEIGRYFQFAPSLQIMSGGYVWHSDHETPDTISTTGIQAVTRAYAKVMADVNTLDLRDVRTPTMSQ